MSNLILHTAADNAARHIKSAKIQVSELGHLANTLGERIDKLESALMSLRNCGFNFNDSLSQDLAKIQERLVFIRQYKNQMELGDLTIRSTRTLDEVWRALP